MKLNTRPQQQQRRMLINHIHPDKKSRKSREHTNSFSIINREARTKKRKGRQRDEVRERRRERVREEKKRNSELTVKLWWWFLPQNFSFSFARSFSLSVIVSLEVTKILTRIRRTFLSSIGAFVVEREKEAPAVRVCVYVCVCVYDWPSRKIDVLLCGYNTCACVCMCYLN